MRKWLLALAALLITSSAYAAFGIFQTYLPAPDPRVQKNLVTDYGATCNGKYADRSVTITNSGAGLRDVEVIGASFAGGDVGKTIAIEGAGANGNPHSSTIATVTDATHIILSSNATSNPAGATRAVIYGADDTSAFLAFKAAFQGPTAVQLNLPGNCTFLPTSGANQFPFKGVTDLVVAGNGTVTSGILNIASGNWIFGGGGQGVATPTAPQYESLPFVTANAGDSCVILKTAPSITISDVGQSVAPTSVFNASASGTTLTVNSVASGTIVPGAVIHSANANQGFFNTIQPYGTAGTTGVGGTGTYALSVSTTLAAQTVYTSQASFTASVNTAGVMNVTAVQDGTIAVGLSLFGASNYGGTGGLTRGPTTVKSQISGTPGGIGTYQLDNVIASGANPAAAPSQQFQLLAQIRLTVNSTAGITSGDTIPVSGVTGQGGLPQRTNGLKWVKVVDGTHLDIFQWTFEGGYTSGGVAGGDRTSVVPPGTKVMLGGYTLQTYWGAPYGFPSNFHWFEWLTVASVNSSTHEVCFTTPLQNTYKDTWPRMNAGSQFELDGGGPATMYPVDVEWDTTHVYKDFALVNPQFQTAAGGRNITWSNVAPTGVHCMIPSQNETYTWVNNATSLCSIESDKLIKTWNITNSPMNQVNIQSSSIDTININGSTIDRWFGSPKKLNADASTFPTAFTVGTIAYGASDESICTNCTNGAALTGQGDGIRVDSVGQPWSMSGGVITIPNAYSYSGGNAFSELQIRYIVPGYYSYWSGGGGGGASAQVGRFFKVTDVTQDLDNIYVTTTEAGSFPTGAWVTNGLTLKPHPAPKLTVSFLPGSADGALWFNGCSAQHPMFSCANYTRTGGSSGTTTTVGPTMWGELTSFTFTNNVPYTNTGSLSWTSPQFATMRYLDTSNVQTGINFVINTKLPSSAGGGTRTFTSSGVTGNQVGDVFPSAPPAGAVFGTSIGLSLFSANTPSDSPEVTVTLRTNQNLP